MLRLTRNPWSCDQTNWAGADEGNRTPTLSLAADFESATSTSSITSAYKNGPLSKREWSMKISYKVPVKGI